jgi:drug/metabolite transporter (DMT)-like permease
MDTPVTGTAGAGELSMLLAAVAYGVSTTVSVAALDVVKPADLVAIELSGAAVALFAVALLSGRVRRAGAGRNFLLGALMPGLAFVLGDLGLSRTSASAGSLLFAADIPISVMLSVLVLREALRGRAVVALVLGLSGSAIVALGNGGGGTSTTLGNVLVLSSVGASAAFLVVTRKYNDDDGLNASAWQTFGAAVCTSPFVLIGWWHSGSTLPTAGWEGWGYGLGVLASTAAAGVAFNWGISRVPGVRASQLLNLAPVVGLVSAVLVLDERPAPWQMFGGAVVLLAVVILVRSVEGSDTAAAERVDESVARTPVGDVLEPAVRPGPVTLTDVVGVRAFLPREELEC